MSKYSCYRVRFELQNAAGKQVSGPYKCRSESAVVHVAISTRPLWRVRWRQR